MDVRILYDDLAALLDRHHGVSGTRFIDDENYEPGALVPDPGVVPVPVGVVEQLRATGDTPDTALIELVRPPQRLIALARELTADVGPGRFVHARIEVAEAGGGAYDVTFVSVESSPPNALTTTINPKTRLRHALHPDNWDALPLAVRLARSRRRLAINLGPGPRYLLIAFPDVIEISRTLRPADDQHIPRAVDVRDYARHYRTAMTVHWLRIDPGEAYLAPTELVAHDGSTLNVHQPSDIAFYLGRWPRGFFPSLLT